MAGARVVVRGRLEQEQERSSNRGSRAGAVVDKTPGASTRVISDLILILWWSLSTYDCIGAKGAYLDRSYYLR